MPEHIAQTLLRQAHSPAVADAIFTDKVLHKPLRLRSTSPDPTSSDARAVRRRQRLRKKEKAGRRQKPQPLSAREKRITGIYDVPDSARKYEIYVPLHKMWVEYMWEVLGMKTGERSYVTAQNTASKLTSADYHGANISVVRSRCVGMVGLAGIVIRDTKFTFQLITGKNELKTIPKRHTVFRFEIPQPELKQEHEGGPRDTEEQGEKIQPQPLAFELHGSHFELRPTDRATKKMKQRKMDDL